MQNSQSIRENITEASTLVDRGGAEGQLSDAIKCLEKAAKNVENVLDEPIEALGGLNLNYKKRSLASLMCYLV